MSYCREEGKDQIIFVTKEDHNSPIQADGPLVTLPDPKEHEGAIREDGSINWGCPCMASMVSGPCGYEFREAFSCFHNSESEPKGKECMEPFFAMKECFDKYPTVYGGDLDPTNVNDEEQQTDPATASHSRSSPSPSTSNSEDKSSSS